MKAFLAMILFFGGLLHAKPEYMYEVQVASSDSLDVVVQRNQMNSFFTDGKIDWNGGLFYLFVDKGEVSRLFAYYGGDSLDLYQMPSAGIPRWTNPSEYMEQMQILKTTVEKDRCQQKIGVEKSLGIEFHSMELDAYPMVRVKTQRAHSSFEYDYVPSYNRTFYCGYVKLNGQSKYFRFADFRQEGAELRYPLSKFVPIFEKLDRFPFTVELKGCK